MVQFRLTSRARADLREVFRYVAEHGGVEVARRLRLRDRLLLLGEHPIFGVARPEFDLPNLRSHVVPNTRYVIFYYRRDYGVEILHVRHGSRNLTTFFEQDL